MNSYIKLKNGLIINLSQIEVIGPVVPFSLTYQGIFTNDDKRDDSVGEYDLGYKLDMLGNSDNTGNLTENVFCVPVNATVNNDAYNINESDSLTQPYMILLKSGRCILLTANEYNNIVEVMKFSSENYSNIDRQYTKFTL